MKIAYLDCPTGLSGDMCLGALVHAGVPLEYLIEQLGRLGIAEEYHLRAEFVHRNGQQATKVAVDLKNREHTHPDDNSPRHRAANRQESSYSKLHEHEHSHGPGHSHRPEHSRPEHSRPEHSHGPEHSPAGHSHTGHSVEHHKHDHHDHSSVKPTQSHQHSRHLPEIEALILAANLPQRVKDWSLAVFQRLAEAEGAVHGIAPDQVHFHEVGATDAIVDIVGTCLGLDYLGIEQLYCSALPVGGGTVWAAHGRLPVPPPAVLKLWEIRQVPVYSNGINQEMVTPTGAALVTVLATQFGPPPPLLLQKVGLGAGSKDLTIPNILRLWIGTTEAGQDSVKNSVRPAIAVADHSTLEALETLETIAVLETQIDDLNPQAIGYVMSELLNAGVLDVFTQSVGMKKSRLGILLTVLCRPDQVAICEAILFRETTTLGIRRSQQQRRALSRRFEQVLTPYGPVQIKVATQAGEVTNVQPEYEDCAHLARQHQVAWREVHRLALQAWYNKLEVPANQKHQAKTLNH